MKDIKALLAAILAFSFWGLFPVYWKWFYEIKGFHLFFHRLGWSFITLWLIIILGKRWGQFKETWRGNKKFWLTASAILISSNWLIYMMAITQGKILEASMGYFLNPLINVMAGFLFLKEKIRMTQWPSIILAFCAVVWLGISSGLTSFPWVALTLSATFAAYGLIRKLTHVGSLEGLTFETTVVFIPFMLWWMSEDGNPIHDYQILGIQKSLILTLSGVITCLPLVLFAFSTKRLTLQTLGFTQYLSPSLKFICGWLIFHEPLSSERLWAFIMIWIALAWYSSESLWFNRQFLTRPRAKG